MKILAIVQARMGSSRLPGKVMKRIEGRPAIKLLLERLKLSKKIDQIVVATTNNDVDIPLKEYLISQGFLCETGSENNVLERFVSVSRKYEASVVVRITGDCPLIDPSLVDDAIEYFLKENLDYVTNSNPPSYPDGLDIEVFSSKVLYEAHNFTDKPFDLEHVTPYIRNNKKLNTENLKYDVDLSHLRWTLDESADLEVIKRIYKNFSPNIDFSWKDVLNLHTNNQNIFHENQDIARNEGSNMSKGQKLYKRAKEIIPGGNMLLSKRPEMFLPEKWPSYFSKSKGCHVWDLDGKKYIDMSIMGVGTNILGYGHDEVDQSVKDCVAAGNMSTLNCPEEVFLAEKLLEINPWADMARFARSGGEANAIAIRIARAASGKDNVAICGYHGWHDWYLSANLSEKDTLNNHLLPGLEANGVPKNLIGSVYPFNYNNFDELEQLIQTKNIGTIKMEVERSSGPKNNFLKKVRKLASDNNIILIFDECTSGFRETYGGLHLKYGVEPDMAMYGKALGNGYAITAIIGKREIMEAAQSTFISSTFWTERIGPSAGLKTLEVMESTKSWEKISNTGESIKSKWERLSQLHKLKIEISGLKALPGFIFHSKNNLAYKTFLTQEMLKKGFLASNNVYVCIEHNDKIIDDYFYELDKIFQKIKKCEDGQNIMSLLDGPICHSGFSRLN
jgi:glutamate-1-semialdehyde 2,1-aminomutase